MGAIATQIILMLHEADCLCDPAEGLGTNNTILLGPVQFSAHGCKPHLTGHGCRTHPFPKECPLTWTMAQDHSLKSYKTVTMGSLQHWNKNRRCLGSPWCDQHFLGCSYVFGCSRNLHSPHHINDTSTLTNLPDLYAEPLEPVRIILSGWHRNHPEGYQAHHCPWFDLESICVCARGFEGGIKKRFLGKSSKKNNKSALVINIPFAKQYKVKRVTLI